MEIKEFKYISWNNDKQDFSKLGMSLMLTCIKSYLNRNIENEKEREDLKGWFQEGIILFHDIKYAEDYFSINNEVSKELPTFSFYLAGRYTKLIEGLSQVEGKTKEFFDDKKTFNNTIKTSFSENETLNDKLGIYSFNNIFEGNNQRNRQSYWFLKTIYPILENVYFENFKSYFYDEYGKIKIAPFAQNLHLPIKQFFKELEIKYDSNL